MTSLLRIYLNDQLAAGVLVRDLARRSHRQNAGTPLGHALERVATAAAEDVAAHEGVMRKLGLRRNPLKTVGVRVGERLGRLKPNGRVRSYSPLSRLVELDLLILGLASRSTFWTTLRDDAGVAPRLPDVDFDGLAAAADRLRGELEPFRSSSAREALAA